MICSRITERRRTFRRVLVSAALFCLLAFFCIGTALAAGEPEFWISPDGTLTPDAITCSKAEDGKYYLMLPAAVDPENLCFGVADGVKFTFRNKTIQTGDSARELKEGDFSVKVNKKGFTMHVMIGSPGLPAVFVTTESGSLKQIESSKANREPGQLVFVGPEGDVQYSGGLEHIKARGNSSMTFAKKNYQIKLEKGADLMGMGKAKKWILTGNYRDKSHLRNRIMMDLADAIGLPYTVKNTPAELYINHEYRGLYLLSEKIEIDDDRINIADLEKATKEINDKSLSEYKLIGKRKATKGSFKAYDIPANPEDITGGYLVEYESYTSRYRDEASAYTTKRGSVLVVKSPEYASREQMTYISGLMQSFENAIKAGDGTDPETGKHYTEIADAESLALKYMIEEISENYDGNSSSQYFFKPADSVSEKFFSGPVWDYDSTFGAYAQPRNAKKVTNPAFLWIAEGDKNAWYPMLWTHQDFRTLVDTLWNERVRTGVEVLLGNKTAEEAGIGSGKLRSIDEYADAIRKSVKMDRIRWPRKSKPSADSAAWTGASFEENVKYLKDYLQKRRDFLDEAWGANAP